MSDDLTQEAVDSAILLENRINERVEKEVNRIINRQVNKIVKNEVQEALLAYKQAMMMEISVTIGKIMRHTEEENRKPLWESTPEELGLNPTDLNKHMIERTTHAIRKQEAPIQERI
jgi:hypothetical protein